MNRHQWSCFAVTGIGACMFAAGITLAAAVAATAGSGVAVRSLADGAEKKEDKGEKIALDKLPKKVVDAVKKEMPGSRVTKAYKKTAEGKTVYLLDDVKVGKKGWDVTVSEEGAILKKEECLDSD